MPEPNTSDHLANVRTFLSWVRTAITIMALGFVVSKFGLLLRELNPTSPGSSSPVSEIVGVLLVLSACVLLVLATIRFQRTKQSIQEDRFVADATLEYIFAGLLVLVGIGLAIYLLGIV